MKRCGTQTKRHRDGSKMDPVITDRRVLVALSDAFGRFQHNRILPTPFAFARWGIPCHFKRSGSDKIQCWDRLYEHEIRVSQRTPPESGVVSARQRKTLLPSNALKALYNRVLAIFDCAYATKSAFEGVVPL